MSDLTQTTRLSTSTDSRDNNDAAIRTQEGSAPKNTEPVAAAKWAVAEYLRDVGLRDPDLIARESCRIVAKAEAIPPASGNGDETSLSEIAIQLTVKQLDHWLLALAASSGDGAGPQKLGCVVGARLPDLLSRYPEALKQKRPPVEVVDALRNDLTPVVPKPKPRPMRRQNLALLPSSFKRLRSNITNPFTQKKVQPEPELGRHTRPANLPHRPALRLSLATITLLSTALGTWIFCRAIAADGFGAIDFALAVLFAVLFVWVAFSFWTASLGLFVILRRRGRKSPRDSADVSGGLPPTAVVMPIYNEEPLQVFSNIRAIAESVRETGNDTNFSVFVLSDTTDPGTWLEEEKAWAKLVADLPAHSRIFYRHRPKNVSRKAGNVADFCRRWGEHYKYMIVLDADSVMAGETLVEMVRRMEQDPQIGILQVPPRPINRQSFFARMQQFAAHVYGPVFLEGFALWSQCDGNYWGHNAIIRVAPFMEHCELPILPGEGPLSGEILSHDFVEAALIRRAGWKVCLAHDLAGSYEECPTTILDFAQRDQRWCQGNLQHVRLLLAEGLHPASRLHFGMGAMSYLASPLWLAFLILTMLGALFGSDVSAARIDAPSGALLFVTTMSLLLLPKLWGVIALSQQPRPSNESGWSRPLVSALIETIASALIAPIMMLLHTQFVISTLLGKKVKWSAQQRDDSGVPLRAAFEVHYLHTLAGLTIGGIAWIWVPYLLPWLLPVLLGLVLSIPLAMLLGSVRIGKWLSQERLLTIPEEIDPPAVLKHQQEALKRAQSNSTDSADPFESVIADPAFYALHVGILRATDSHVPLSPAQLQRITQLWKSGALASAPTDVRRAVLSDCGTMETLHTLARSHLAPTQSLLLA